jgi:amidase
MHAVLRCSAAGQASLVRSRKISPVELVRAHLEQIARVNPQINAVVDLLADRALAMAQACDEARARGGPAGPLNGVPFSIKDSIEVEDSRCTAGTLGRRQAEVSRGDATLVARLRRAGAIPIAKTNLPDLLFAFESDNLLFGATKNPYGLDRTSGGSSGGEAALIAAGGSPMGLGSDAAGSVRVPAAFCGIASIKPTSGRLPRTGHFPPAGGWIERLWQMGPMARRVEDLSLMMRLLVGGDGADATVVDMPFPDPAEVDLLRLRACFYTDNGFAAADAEVIQTVHAAARALSDVVADVVEEPPPGVELAYDLEMKLLGPDGGDSLRAYLHSLGSQEVHPLLSGWLEKLERYRTDLAGFAGYWAEWDCFRSQAARFLKRFDVILCPVSARPAVPHGTSIVDENFRGFSYTMAYNVLGWPAAVVRCGNSAEGLPIGVQVVAHPFCEHVALAVAGHLERVFGGWQPPAMA